MGCKNGGMKGCQVIKGSKHFSKITKMYLLKKNVSIKNFVTELTLFLLNLVMVMNLYIFITDVVIIFV